MTEDIIPNDYKDTTPRNLGDENLEPIQTLEYAWHILFFIDKNNTNKTNLDGTASLDISEETLNKIISETVEKIHKNAKYPENHNIFYRDEKLYVYENNKWSIVSINKVKEVMDRTKFRILKLLGDDYKNLKMKNNKKKI